MFSCNKSVFFSFCDCDRRTGGFDCSVELVSSSGKTLYLCAIRNYVSVFSHFKRTVATSSVVSLFVCLYF